MEFHLRAGGECHLLWLVVTPGHNLITKLQNFVPSWFRDRDDATRLSAAESFALARDLNPLKPRCGRAAPDVIKNCLGARL